ncbi:type VII secretion system-associated protein [Streptomyces sp. NBC_01013]|uniref:type VII secretion system-associated protein n=1 Tax=Streptomyces sp. NBC_01013 TaxID=2903718 RepID=UPI003868E19A|nr:type VII secretion system-associated protein [Streptomyces sp. NBC_01013]
MPTTSGQPDGAPGPAPASGAAPGRAAVSAPVAAQPPVTVARGEPDFPVPPEDIVAAALTAPDHWLSVTDRHWLGATGEEPAPPWAVLGRWRSNARGRIVSWEANPDYRPSPAALGWAPPVDDADAALHLAATGYGPDEDVAEAIAEAGTVAVCVAEDGEPARTRIPGGTHAVPAFTSPPPGAPADRIPAHVTMTLPALLDLLPSGRDVLLLSPSAPASLLLPADELREQGQRASAASLDRTRSTGRSRTDSGTPSKRGQDE